MSDIMGPNGSFVIYNTKESTDAYELEIRRKVALRDVISKKSVTWYTRFRPQRLVRVMVV